MTEGKFKGRQGVVIKALRKSNQLVIEGVNEVTRLHKTSADSVPFQKTYSAPVHYSNVQLVDPSTGKPTKVGMSKDANGKNQRFARKTGAIIPKPANQGKRKTPKPAGDASMDTPLEVVAEVTYKPETFKPEHVFDKYIDNSSHHVVRKKFTVTSE